MVTPVLMVYFLLISSVIYYLYLVTMLNYLSHCYNVQAL